jgi:hypothetical protein
MELLDDIYLDEDNFTSHDYIAVGHWCYMKNKNDKMEKHINDRLSYLRTKQNQ